MKVAFLDRDGVINEDYGYVYKIEDFKFKEGIFELLELLKSLGFEFFIVTNQSGIARGYYTKDDFFKLTKWLLNELEQKGFNIKDVEYCSCHEKFSKNCECRKPKPTMILNLAKKYNIDIKNSIFIGDKQTDMDAAQNAGIKNRYLVKNSLFDIIERIKNDFKGSI